MTYIRPPFSFHIKPYQSFVSVSYLVIYQSKMPIYQGWDSHQTKIWHISSVFHISISYITSNCYPSNIYQPSYQSFIYQSIHQPCKSDYTYMKPLSNQPSAFVYQSVFTYINQLSWSYTKSDFHISNHLFLIIISYIKLFN